MTGQDRIELDKILCLFLGRDLVFSIHPNEKELLRHEIVSIADGPVWMTWDDAGKALADKIGGSANLGAYLTQLKGDKNV